MIVDLIGLIIVMLIVAGLIFAPLGYFIYIYTIKDGEPFGDTEHQGNRESKVLDLTEQVIYKIKELLTKK